MKRNAWNWVGMDAWFEAKRYTKAKQDGIEDRINSIINEQYVHETQDQLRIKGKSKQKLLFESGK